MKNFTHLLQAAILACVIIQSTSAQSLQGQALADSLLKELPKIKADTAKIKAYSSLAVALAPNDRSAALNYANQCMNVSKQVKWTKGIGLAHYAFAKVYYETTNYTLSLQNGLEAYEVSKSVNDRENMAFALRLTGTVYERLGYFTKAVENAFAALRLFEEINDKRRAGSCYLNIGNVYSSMADYDKAIEYYNKALTISNQLGDKFNIASVLGNIATVFFDKKRYDSADAYYLRALRIFEEIDFQPEISRIYYNRGNLFMRLYDAKSAYEYYMLAAEIDKRLDSKIELADDYGAIGKLYLDVAKDSSSKFRVAPLFEKGKKSLLLKARSFIAQSLSVIQSEGDIFLKMLYTYHAAETEEMLGNYQKALELQKEAAVYKDSIFNDEHKKKIAALETERLVEVKDKEIELLAKTKALQESEIKRQVLIKNIILVSVGAVLLLGFLFIWSYNRRKKAAFDRQVMDTEMKALRAQMNPHFIFNSLNSINRYILENDKENASGYLSKFAKLMRLILENSREHYVTLEQDLIALELYIEMEALRFQNRFRYKVEIDEDIDKENTLVPPLLLQPFVENSIVHGLQQKEGGFIKIKISATADDMIRCIVEDNGIGRQGTPIADPAKQKNRKSLGLKITKERLDIINHFRKVKTAITFFDIKDEDDKPGGLRVELLLPLQLAF